MTITDANALLDKVRAEPLIRNGKYVIGGQDFTRVTTFAKSIDDHYGLDRWQMRMVALGLGTRRDLYAKAASLTSSNEDRSSLDEVCEEAKEAASANAGANLGTALHAFTERVDRGEQFDVPAPWDADLEAYTATLAGAGVRVYPELMELVIVQRRLQVAGRFDRIVTIDGYPLPMIADLKTGNVDRSWSAIGVQLALYANADEIYDPDTETSKPMPDVDKEQALVIHLPAGTGTCELYMVDIAAGWRAAQLCAEVRSWRGNRRIASKFEPPARERARWLTERVTNLRDHHPEALASLAARWPAGVPTFKQGGPQAPEDMTAVALALSAVEAEHGVPFGDPDPVGHGVDPSIVTALTARLKRLPADLGAELTTSAQEQGIPHVQGRRFAARHVDDLEPLLAGAEDRARERATEAFTLVSDIAGTDDAQFAATCTACGTDGTSWTATQLEVLRALRNYVGEHGCVFDTADGTTVLTLVDGEKRLVDLYGGKRDALAAVKQIAESFGLAKPKSVADAVGTTGLLALACMATTP